LRWVGIDEAGYGPNLGPLVLTGVVAEWNVERAARGCAPPRTLDFWGDLAQTVDRAGGDPGKVWVDDSKRILHGGKGRARLEHAFRAAIGAIGRPVPESIVDLLAILGAGTLEEVEIARWLEERKVPAPKLVGDASASLATMAAQQVLCPAHSNWRLTAIRSVIIGPARFNRALAATGVKSAVHFGAFAELLRWIWDQAGDGASTQVACDKHGGRHYYFPGLCQTFPDAWIDRGDEGPDLSRYAIRDRSRTIEIRLSPRADQTDGLVALASLVSKALRELWMDVFNGYWSARLPGLRPTAGYPLDATRFRREIDQAACADNCDPATWWRIK
jgi:hypothetical protein